MDEDFEKSWRQWKEANQDLWDKGINFGVSSDNKSITNVEALVNCVLQTKTPLYFGNKSNEALIGIIKEFNKEEILEKIEFLEIIMVSLKIIFLIII